MPDDQPNMESILQTLRELYEREETEKRLAKGTLTVLSQADVIRSKKKKTKSRMEI